MDPNETKIYAAFLIAALILGVFFIFFVITMLRHQRKNVSDYKEKILAEINTLESERARFASDLHDDLGPTLSSVKLLVNDLSLAGDEDQVTLERVNFYIDSILQRVRSISNNLMPQALIRKGLKVAIEEFSSEINERGGLLRIRFCADEKVQLASDIEIHMYRIIQEIINNVIKHAGASECKIELSQSFGKRVKLIIEDDGCGFDTGDMAVTSKGLGLHNIMSRVETMKGKLYLESGPGKGTVYTIEIP